MVEKASDTVQKSEELPRQYQFLLGKSSCDSKIPAKIKGCAFL